MSGSFVGFDRVKRLLTMKDAIGTVFEFSLRDDTKIRSANVAEQRLDEYLERNEAGTPWKASQWISIGWKPSTDGKKRVAVSVR